MTRTATPQRSVEASDLARRQLNDTPMRDTQNDPTGEQLALLPPDEDVPVQLRLSQHTRRVGLAGIAMARAILADQAARRRQAEAAAEHISPPRAA
jgi:hypothetical protein